MKAKKRRKILKSVKLKGKTMKQRVDIFGLSFF